MRMITATLVTMAIALAWLGANLTPARACGIGQPFTMVANDTRALAYPISAATAAHPLGIFPISVAVGTPVSLSELIASNNLSFSPNDYDWLWNFGDGATAEGLSVSHTFALPATVLITLSLVSKSDPATRTENFDTAELHVVEQVFTDPPIANASASETVVAVNGSVTYDSTDSSSRVEGGVNLVWNFGDGAVTSGRHVTHRFTQLGDGNVALIVTDARGASTVALLPIRVVPQLPTADISMLNTSVKIAQTITFDGSTSTVPSGQDNHIADYLWDFGDGTQQESPQPQVTHTYRTPGTYTVSLQVTDMQGLSGSTSLNLIITPQSPTPQGSSPFSLSLLIAGGLLTASLLVWIMKQRRHHAGASLSVLI